MLLEKPLSFLFRSKQDILPLNWWDVYFAPEEDWQSSFNLSSFCLQSDTKSSSRLKNNEKVPSVFFLPSKWYHFFFKPEEEWQSSLSLASAFKVKHVFFAPGEEWQRSSSLASAFKVVARRCAWSEMTNLFFVLPQPSKW